LNNQENNLSQSDINIEQNNIKEKDFTFLDQSQLENLINNSEKFKELLNFISEKNTNADDLYRNYLNELNENNYLNLEEEKINLKADIKNLEKIYEEESKSEYFVDKSKIRFAFKSFILSQINILDLENLVVKFRNNFNLEISSQIELNEENKYENENENENKMKKEKEIENIFDKNEELKLRIENIIRDEKNYNDIKNDYNNSECN
jgi:hypothetical protein